MYYGLREFIIYPQYHKAARSGRTAAGERADMKGIKLHGATQNQIKIIAAVFMVADHVGVLLLPQLQILRIVGRLAFPLFAFFVYEGFRYTRSRVKYFLQMFTLGILCGAVYYFYTGAFFGNVLITFSASILLLAATAFFRDRINAAAKDKILGALLVLCAFAAVYGICLLVEVDYGFWGAVLPVFAALAHGHAKSDTADKYIVLASFALGLVIMCFNVTTLGAVQFYSLLAMPLLALYNGQRGRLKMKSFFYWFYPGHLVAIQLVALLLNG